MFDIKEISLKNMILTALTCWRSIIIAALICAIACPVLFSFIGEKNATLAENRKMDTNDLAAKEQNIRTLSDMYRQYAINEDNMESTGNEKARNDLVEANYNLNSEIAALSSMMTSEQIDYAHKVADGSVNKSSIGDFLSEEESRASATNNTVALGGASILVNALCGAIIGAFIVLFVRCLIYAFSGKLHCVKELADHPELAPFGVIVHSVDNRFGCGIDDRLRRKLVHVDEGVALSRMISETVYSVSAYCEQKNIKSICFISSLRDKPYGDVVTGIIDGLKEKGISAEYKDGPLTNVESLQKCAETDGTILVESIGHSCLTEIERLVLTCERYGISTFGSVVLL